MEITKLRNNSFYQDLSPVCTKIKNVSLDFYSGLKPKKTSFKLEPILLNTDSEDQKTFRTKVRVNIDRFQEPIHSKKLEKLPTIPIQKISDLYLKPLKTEIPITASRNIEKKITKLKSMKKNRKSDMGSYSSAKLKPRVISKVTYAEASQYSDWALIAKPEIEKMWKNLVWLSNGMEPVKEKTVYKYFVGKGNNSELIRALLGARGWWSETSVFSEAHFIWTQWKENQVFELLPKGLNLTHLFDVNALCSLTYQVPVKIGENYRQVDISDLGFHKIKNSYSFTTLKTTQFLPSEQRLYNKLEFNQHLSNKKGLLKYMKKYYKMLGLNFFDVHPLTFHVKSLQDPQFQRFVESFKLLEKKKKNLKNVWIVKPGENTNRGQGIKVCRDLLEISEAIGDNSESFKTFIVQKYIERPFLVHSRKFDIRCFTLVTSINGIFQAYFYSDGYLRTSCVEYNLSNTENTFIHLTNDAIQKHSDEYGRFEDNNKMSYKEFQRYLDFNYFDKKFNFIENVLPKIKSIVKDSISATFLELDRCKRLNSMEIFGYDFMLDYKLKPWIIEVNTNPCLELSSSYLSEVIPGMVDNAFRIVLDSCFPQVNPGKNTFEPIAKNKFELIFHELTDGIKVKNMTQFNSSCSDHT